MLRKARATAGADGEADEPPPFFFAGIESPNGTIFPDALLDFVMPFLSPSEWKVCSYVVRRTFGWKKASDQISLDQICHGIVRRDGTPLDHGTRLDRKTAIKALRGLEAKGVIVAQRNYSQARGFEATTYGLRFRGQAPTHTLGETLPQGGDGLGEGFPSPDGTLPPAPAERFHQPGGAIPPALGAPFHPQPTTSSTNNRQGEKQQGKQNATITSGAGIASVATAAADGSLWEAVLARLAGEMSAANFATWLADTRPLGRQGNLLVVGTPSRHVCDWLQARFRPLVRRALQAEAAELTDVAFTAPEG